MKPTLLCLLLLAVSTGCTSRIDREAVVARHRIVTHATDPHSPAQVGNGGFAFGMDITGLQTFVPFNTLSDWGWHSFPQDETTRRHGSTLRRRGRTGFCYAPATAADSP